MYSASACSSAPYSSSGGYRGQEPVVFALVGGTQLTINSVATKRTEFAFATGATPVFRSAAKKRSVVSIAGTTTFNYAGYTLRVATTTIPCGSIFTVKPRFVAHVKYQIFTGTTLSVKDGFNFPMRAYSNGKTTVKAKTGAMARSAFAIFGGSTPSFRAKKLFSTSMSIAGSTTLGFLSTKKLRSAFAFPGSTQTSFASTKRYSSGVVVVGHSTASFESNYTLVTVPHLDTSADVVFIHTATPEQAILE